MSLDDLLGLLFLLVFVVGPILKGLFRGSAEAPLLEVELEPEKPELEPETPPPSPEPKPEPAPVRPVMVAPPAPKPQSAQPAAPAPRRKKRRGRRMKLRFDSSGILEGVVWHEILSEPRARRRWKPKR